MKKIIIAVFLNLAVLLALAYAHPPKDITITFDVNKEKIQAVVIHPTKNPDRHFIKKVIISLNQKEIATLNFKKQDDSFARTVEYNIPQAKDGDVLCVEAYCSISGKLKKEIKLKD